MNRRICWLLFFSLSILLLQAQENLPKAGDCTITVWMKNPIAKEIIADIEPISLARLTTRNQKKIILDDKNKGFLKIPLKGPSIIKLMNVWADSNVSYIAIPGVDMVFHLDTRGEDKTQYNDIGPKETEFYLDVLAKSREKLKAIPQQDAEKYLKTWEQEFNAMQKLIADSVTGMPSGYTTWILQSIQSLFQSALSRQLVTYVTMTQRWPVNIDEYKNKVAAFTITQFNQPGLFTRETDKELVESYYLFYSLIEDRKKKMPAPGAETTYRNAINYAKKITAEGPRNITLRYLVTSITAHTTDTSFLRWMASTIVFDKQNEHLKKLIAEKQKLLRKAGKDKSAPFFEATDISGNKFGYKNFEGKYLYIDIWATWCVPCKKEIPFVEQLKKKYAGQSIEFISVSIDKNVDAWKKFVKAAESKDQFHSMPGKASCVNEVYNAPLIPAFVLIDPQGKIINPACFRPSDPALDFLLDELLQKNNVQPTQ
ncbi:MAG TPA: TlpA disulfide reductase family protein [Chitinophagaceae bacterium]|nr:TlpA disulfide reductase family protein [Chitinophagaceae bacterium]